VIGRFALVGAAIAAALSPAQAAHSAPLAEVFAVRAKVLDLGDGRRVENGVLVVDGGKVRAAGAGVQIPSDVAVIDHDGYVTAGMVACHSYDGLSGENADPTRAVMPEARIIDAFDPSAADFARALAAGITTIVLTPAPTNLVSGRAAVVKTAGGRVVENDAHLMLSFSSQALSLNRYPTSSSGAVAELEARFKAPRGAFAEVTAGKRQVILDARSRNEVQRALDFAERHGLKGAVNGANRAGELLQDVRKSGLGVIVGPFGEGTSSLALDSVVALGEARVPLAFGLDAPWTHPDALRFSAALCVRAGLEPEVAWKALTSDGARIANVHKELGRLDAGLDADFVLWTGDPLDLTSAVVEVYVDGVRVHGGAR
jgi:imidazolonepropionase-like amidohydrolase